MTRRGAGSRSCRAGGSFAPPRGATGAVFQDDPFRLELVADAIGGREVAVRLSLGALGDPPVNRSPLFQGEPSEIREPVTSILAKQPEWLCAGFHDRGIIDCHETRQCERRIQIIAERVDHSFVYFARLGIARDPIEPVEISLGLSD